MLNWSLPSESETPPSVCVTPPIVAVAFSVARLNPAADPIVASTL